MLEPSFLVPTGKSVEPGDPCPRLAEPRKVYIPGQRDRWFWAGCEWWGCLLCGPRRVRQQAAVVGWSATRHDRQRFLTLTQAPDEWQARRQRMRDYKRQLAAKGLACEWAWTTEKGGENGMVHIHAVQWGDYLPWRTLLDVWGHRVNIKEVKTEPQLVAGYISKGAGAVAGYLTKEAQADYLGWLDLNGGRPWHTSRGFHGPGGYEAARKALQAAKRAAGAPSWRSCAGDVPYSDAEWQMHLGDLWLGTVRTEDGDLYRRD